MLGAALRGFGLGFAIALTPGPMFFMCLRRTLSAGWRAGAAAGFGIASADGIYAAVAGTGIGVAGALLGGAHRWIALGGGLALLVLGLLSLRRPRASAPSATTTAGLGAAYGTSLALTLANPATILAFAAIFAGVGMAGMSRGQIPLLVLATAAGSLTWWLLLVGSAAVLRRSLGERAARLLGLVSGLAIAAFGLSAAISALVRG